MTGNFKQLLKKIINLTGYEIRRTPAGKWPVRRDGDQHPSPPALPRVHYACGPKPLPGWVNVDMYPLEVMTKRFGMPPEFVYCQADLSGRQPFPDNSFALAFAEDFIEHLSQQESIVFLSECLRVLKTGGVLRLSFPGLAGVLKHHFATAAYGEIAKGVHDAYHHFAHLHFYSREELELVAGHLGFSRIRFASFGCSDHEGLRGLETRDKQQDLNIYVELTK